MGSAADGDRTAAGAVPDGGAAAGLLVRGLPEGRRSPLVGGKCSSLGELINAGVRVPPGFALTTEGYRRFMARGRH